MHTCKSSVLAAEQHWQGRHSLDQAERWCCKSVENSGNVHGGAKRGHETGRDAQEASSAGSEAN